MVTYGVTYSTYFSSIFDYLSLAQLMSNPPKSRTDQMIINRRNNEDITYSSDIERQSIALICKKAGVEMCQAYTYWP